MTKIIFYLFKITTFYSILVKQLGKPQNFGKEVNKELWSLTIILMEQRRRCP